MKLSELMQSDTHITFLDDLDKHIPEKIDRSSKVHETIINLMKKWMQHASISCEDLLHIISNHQKHLIAYIIKNKPPTESQTEAEII